MKNNYSSIVIFFKNGTRDVIENIIAVYRDNDCLILETENRNIEIYTNNVNEIIFEKEQSNGNNSDL